MKTALSGPFIVYGDRNPPGTGSTGTVNSDKAPSVFWGGASLLDPRVGYNVTRAGVIAWGCASELVTIDQVPTTLSATNICGSQAVTAGTAMTLAGASTGITVLGTGGLQVWASGNTVPASALVLDGNPALVTFGIASVASGNTTVSLYDPTKALSRNIRVTTNGDDTGGTYTVAGYDVYGYAMSEAITGVNNAVASGKKCFKFVVSVTPAGTLNSTLVTVGTGDVFGFPLRCDSWGYQETTWVDSGGTNTITASTSNAPFGTSSAITYAVTTSPATTITGDVRGTWYVGTQAPSNGTRRFTLLQEVSAANVGTTTGLVGVTQA